MAFEMSSRQSLEFCLCKTCCGAGLALGGQHWCRSHLGSWSAASRTGTRLVGSADMDVIIETADKL